MFNQFGKRELKSKTKFSPVRSIYYSTIVFLVGLYSSLHLLLESCDLVCAADCLSSSDLIYLWKTLLNFLNPGVLSYPLVVASFCQSFFTFFIFRISGYRLSSWDQTSKNLVPINMNPISLFRQVVFEQLCVCLRLRNSYPFVPHRVKWIEPPHGLVFQVLKCKRIDWIDLPGLVCGGVAIFVFGRSVIHRKIGYNLSLQGSSTTFGDAFCIPYLTSHLGIMWTTFCWWNKIELTEGVG